MLCKVCCASCIGLEVVQVTVEVSVLQGVGIYLIGLPDSAVKESLLRVTTALKSYEYRIPGKKTVINLAPANIRKEGSAFDAAIAVALLAASEQILFSEAEDFLIMGELSLDGRLRPVPGALPIALKAAELGFKGCIFPHESAMEAADVEAIKVFGANNIVDIIDIVNGELYTEALLMKKGEEKKPIRVINEDFADVIGQNFAKRGMEIAASGGHNILLTGPPGAGKSFMSRCLASILPPMGKKESLETSAIYSVAGLSFGKRGLITERPFRAPHHTGSIVSLVGGGQNASPGEISLAHNGVLYLDEITQYGSNALNVLRQPLEDREICISRVRYKVTYPASFMLVGSMNPCPCGYFGDDAHVCTCTSSMIAKYLSKLSGPLMDRIDLNIRVKAVESKALVEGGKEESSCIIAARVEKARKIQEERFKNEEGCYTNSQMNAEQLKRFCYLGPEEKKFMNTVMNKFSLSARAFGRVLKISRTIADMEGCQYITTVHIAEAVQYRFQDIQ